MATISRGAKAGGGTNFNSGQVINPTEVDTDFNTLVTLVNGNLDNGNIATATIPGAKSLRFTEISLPTNPSSDDGLLYGKDDGGGVTTLAIQDSSGRVTMVGREALMGTALVPMKALGAVNNENWAGTSTGANTTETTAWTFDLPANSLSATNDLLYITCWFKTAANANTKRFRVYFGATAIVDTTAIAFNNVIGLIQCWVGRTGAATQNALTYWQTAVVGFNPTLATPAETLSGAVTVKGTMLNGTATASDCTMYGGSALLVPAYATF